MKKNLFIGILFLTSLVGFSQEQARRPVFLGIKAHPTGFIIPHRDTLKDIASSTPRGLQLEVSRFNYSEKSWQSCNCYARTGFSFLFFDYGNNAQLGQSYNLSFFIEPYLNVNNKLTFSYRAAMALTYLNRVYDAVDNSENLFYSSPISYMLLVSLNANYEVHKNWRLNTSLNYNHISNGGMKQPNLGMNFPTLSVGVDYVLNPMEKSLPKYEKKETHSKRGLIYARFSGSIKTIESNDTVLGTVQKPVIGLEAGYLKPISKLNGLSAGIEIMSDGSWRELNSRWGADFDHRTFNVMIGHHFLLGKFNFGQQLGIYAYKNYPNTSSPFYQRYSLFYQMGKYLNLGFSLKAHVEVAEIMDVRIGMVF